MRNSQLAPSAPHRDSHTKRLSKNVAAGSLSVEDALALAARLNTAEQAGWPKGFDPVVVGRYWNEILWTLWDEYSRILKETPELAPVTFRRFMKTLDPGWRPDQNTQKALL